MLVYRRVHCFLGGTTKVANSLPPRWPRTTVRPWMRQRRIKADLGISLGISERDTLQQWFPANLHQHFLGNLVMLEILDILKDLESIFFVFCHFIQLKRKRHSGCNHKVWVNGCNMVQQKGTINIHKLCVNSSSLAGRKFQFWCQPLVRLQNLNWIWMDLVFFGGI